VVAGVQQPRRVRGLLEHAGVVLDAIASALRSAHQGHATSIRKVVLDEAALERLGLRAPEQPGST
jgi:hypothetical protein